MCAMTLEYGTSSKGRRTLIYMGNEFWFEKQSNNGNINWRCSKFATHKCRARLVTSNDDIVRNFAIHNHEYNKEKVLAKNAVAKMKEIMLEMNATPSVSRTLVTFGLSLGTLMALPQKSAISRTLNRHQNSLRRKDPTCTLPPLPSDAMFDVPDIYRDFLLYDSKDHSDDARFFIFGDRSLVGALSLSKMWFADGTFMVVPSLFYQLYTIHFQYAEGVTPAIYCLLQNKTAITYNKLLSVLRDMAPNAAPDVILTDFESAAMNAFRSHFPSARVTGCYFHLRQAIQRKICELGMKADYEADDDLRLMIRCLPALAFVPLNDVVDTFEILSKSMPQSERMNELLSYFEHNFVRGRQIGDMRENFAPAVFPPETWNKYEDTNSGVGRTNNAVEGWYHALQSLFSCQHPTMWTFLNGLQKDCRQHTASVLQASAGVHIKQKKKYAEICARTSQVIQQYSTTERLTFLKLIAYISY